MSPSSKDTEKTKAQLIKELAALRQRIAELESLGIEHQRTAEALHEERDKAQKYLDVAGVVFRDLQEERNRVQKYLDVAGVMFVVIDISQEITLINRKGCEVLGCKEKDIIGTRWFDTFVPPNVRGEVKAVFQRLLAGEVKPAEYYENPVLTKSGKERLIAWHNTALTDEDGNIIGILSSGEDITEHKRADEALKESERRYRDLFDSASDAILIRGLEGNIFEVNGAASELTGYTREELVTMNISQFLTPESFSITMENQRRQLEGEAISKRYELELIRGDGSKAIIEAVISMITENEQPVAVQATVRDVTEQRKMRDSLRFYLQKVLVAQEEERKRIARDLHDGAGQSLLLLTHQLDALASDLKNNLDKPTQAKLLQIHSVAVDTLNGLRRYAQELRPAILDDMGLVAALEWMADQLIVENDIDADVKIDMPTDDLPHEVQLALFRIAQEAIGNLKRHAEASKVEIKLEKRRGKLTMVISDDGKGFEVPRRISDIGSSGRLGIIGMQERAQLLRGAFSIESEVGKGTTVTVEVPIEE